MSHRRPGPTTVVELVPARRRRPSPADMPALVASAGATPTTALVAAATEVEVKAGSQPKPIQTLAWQKEAWRHLDICGELRFAANRFGAAVSRCRIYVAEVDEYGKPGKETEDQAVQGLAETVFGGPVEKVEAIRLIATQGYVVGESYVVAEDRASEEKDVWYVVTTDQIAVEGGSYAVRRPQEAGGGKRVISSGSDLMLRTWNPHPHDTDQADSPTRSVLPVLREIERLSLLTMSQIDSRLISAGLLLLPQGIDFPHGEDDETPGGIVGLMEMILAAAQAQLTGAGDARGLVPILAEVPPGSGVDIQHLRFDTPLQAEIEKKLDHAIRRLALGLDIAPEELLGQGDSNHWSAWAVDETSVKLFIAPALARICLALTIGYLRGALKAMGKDPAKFIFWYDTAALAARPDQREDAFKLWQAGLISTKALLEACNFTEDDAPATEELVTWRLWELVKLQPALVYDPEFQKALGLPKMEQSAGSISRDAEGDKIPLPGAGGGDSKAAEERGLPAADEKTNANEKDGGAPKRKAVKANDGGEKFARLLPAADLLVFRALEIAGGRLLDRQDRHRRGEFASVARYDIHTRAEVGDVERAQAVLDNAFAHAPRAAAHAGVNAAELERLLRAYCVELITHQHPHTSEMLAIVLDRWISNGN